MMSLLPGKSKVLRWIRGLFAFILLFLLTISATITFAVHALAETITSPDVIVKLIEQTRFAERSRALMADLLVTYALQSGQQASFLENQPIDTWENVAENILPVDWVEHHAIHSLLVSLQWLTANESDFPEFSFDLSSPIQALGSSKGSLAILPLLRTIPECEQDTLVITITSSSVSCLPQNYDLTGLAGTMAGFIANSLPETITTSSLKEAGIFDEDVNLAFQKAYLFYAFSVSLELFSARLSLFLLSLYCLLYASSFTTLIKKIPLPLFVIGLFSVVLITVGNLFLSWGLNLVLISGVPGLQTAYQTLIADILRSLSGSAGKLWLSWAIAILVIGAVMQLLIILISKAAQRRSSGATMTRPNKPIIKKSFR